MGKIYGRSADELATEAVRLALTDAGVERAEVDGLLIATTLSPSADPMLQMSLGLEDLTLVNAVSTFGATPGPMLQCAQEAISSGRARTVVCVHTDTPLTPGVAASHSTYSRSGLEEQGTLGRAGYAGLPLAYGDRNSANTAYALAARRHMHRFGTTHDHLGAIAVAQRQWARMNPLAQMRTPMTMQDYHDSRWVVEPLHLYDCCLVSNGAVAVVITSTERAHDLRQPPVHLLGFGQAAPGDNSVTDQDRGVRTGAVRSGAMAMAMSGVTPDDIDVLELYDCYTYTVLVTLEDYGFCQKGEGGPFVADGKLGPGGSLPTNTGGGQLSGYYMWGFTPLSEGIIQARGQAGQRQVPRHDVVLVSGNGGIFDFHSTLILSSRLP
jgi:acetyl-CoA acetyltransferase